MRQNLSGECDSILYLLANTLHGNFPLSIHIEYNRETKEHDAVVEYITREELVKNEFSVEKCLEAK